MSKENGQAVAVPEGYKMTEVGLIPEDWEAQPLGALSESITRGASPRPIADPRWFDVNSKVGWVRISDVTASKRFLYKTAQRLSNEGMRRSRYVEPGSLIMSICATVGRPIETKLDVCIHDGFVVFKNPSIDQSFLYYSLQAIESRWAETGQTGSQMNLNTGLITRTPIPVPPLPEQRAIATALTDTDDLIESLERLIAKKRRIKEGAMGELLSGERRLEGFEGEWEERELAHVVDIRSGGTPSTTRLEYWNGGIPWCTPTDITRLNGRKELRGTERTISPEGLNSSSAELIPAHSVIMTSRATIGECAINVVPVATNQGFKNLIPGPGVDVNFLYYQMSRQKEGLIALCGGSTFLEIGKSTLSRYPIAVPPLPEQHAIATLLTDMDREIEALEEKLAKVRRVKEGMMGELLGGRVRLLERSIGSPTI